VSAGSAPTRRPTCELHPGERAFYDCEGCGKALCLDCARRMGRLMVCGQCGELAVQRPVRAEGRPARSPRPTPPVGFWVDLLGYPLRGRQGVLTAIVLIELALFVASGRLVGEAGCILAVPRTLLLALVPGILGDVFRSTRAGRDSLDEWPDYGAFGARLRELVGFLLTGFYALLPAAALLSWTGCVERLGRGEPMGAGCGALLAIGLLAGAALWLPAFARVATSGELLGWLRLDEQIRLLGRAPGKTFRAVTVCWLAVVTGASLRSVLGPASVVGVLAESLVAAFAAIVAARAAGLWARVVGLQD